MNVGGAPIICTRMADRPRARLLQHGMRAATLLVFAGAVACGGSPKPTTEPGAGSGSGAVDPGVVAQTLVGWGRQQAPGGKVDVFLEVADHTGASKSYPLGTTMGSCGVVPASGPDVVTALRCATDGVTALRCVTAGVGTEFRAVYRGDIIVLKRAVDPSDEPDEVEFLFREVLRVDVPVGSKVGAATP